MIREVSRTFCVPVERKTLAADHPHRWFHLRITTLTAGEAVVEATRVVREDMRLKGCVVWAAVPDMPSFGHMQELRDSLGRASRKGQRKVAGDSL